MKKLTLPWRLKSEAEKLWNCGKRMKAAGSTQMAERFFNRARDKAEQADFESLKLGGMARRVYPLAGKRNLNHAGKKKL